MTMIEKDSSNDLLNRNSKQTTSLTILVDSIFQVIMARTIDLSFQSEFQLLWMELSMLKSWEKWLMKTRDGRTRSLNITQSKCFNTCILHWKITFCIEENRNESSIFDDTSMHQSWTILINSRCTCISYHSLKTIHIVISTSSIFQN